jgi:protein transport protein SEC24
LVNLRESREVIDQLLDSLPTMHKSGQTMVASGTALGVALDAACKIMFHIGGKMCVFQSKLPVLGEGKLANREKKGLLGSDKEHGMLAAAENTYKSKALKFLRQQICVELFLMPVQYCDVATLQVLPKYTAGQLHYFPGFHAGKDGTALYSSICRSLCRNTGWEAVMRVRASHGVKVASSTFYGNFVIRGSDLLSLPNCDADAGFALEFTHDEPQLKTGVVTFQTALLYTTSLGERRIRVITNCVPVTSSAADLLASADQEAVCMLQAKKSVDMVFKVGFEKARNSLQTLCTDLIRSTRANFMGNNGLGPYGAGGAPGSHERPPLPPSLELVPLYTMALIKSPIFRGGADVPLDLRSFYLHQAARMPMDVGMRVMYPHLFGIHDMPEDCGRLVAVPTGEDGKPLPRSKDEAGLYRVDGQRVKVPKPKNLSAAVLSPEACYLLDAGVVMYMWMGRGVAPALLTSLFGVTSLVEVDTSALQLNSQGEKDDEMKTRVLNIIQGLKASRGQHPRMVFVKEGDRHEPAFYAHLVEDRATFAGGNLNYGEYFQGALRSAQATGGY